MSSRLSTLALAIAVILPSCSPRVIETVRTEIEYRDREVHDTVAVEIPVEVEKIVTRDTSSHLENTYARSDASVKDGFLSHSLESKPQIIKVPVTVHVTDTVYREAQIVEKEVKVEKPLTWAQKSKIEAFWWLLGAVLILLAWTFRKPLARCLRLR